MPDRYGQDDNWDDAPKVGPNGCPKGGSCDGHGWVQVQPAYAERTIAMPDPLPLDATDDEQAAYAERVTVVVARRASATEAVYPCKACRNDVFMRWATGHWARSHDAAACPECVDERGRRRTNA